MKLSDFLLFPSLRSKSDGITLTTYTNKAVDDEETEKYLKMLVDATSM